ncbi:MAG: hypothetical protein AB7O28_19915 [Vicinamibacterales bacterium]
MTCISSFVPVRLATAALAAAILALPVAASAQSLAEVARKESARRKEQPAGKVYTNDSLRRDFTPSAPTSAAPPEGSPSEASAAPVPSTEADQASEGPKKDEAYWRDRIGGAREQLARSEAFAAALESQINGLTAEFTSRDDPAQRSVVDGNRKKAIAEHERVQREIEAQRKAIAAIQDEARKAGVPAGWLR